MTNRTRRHRFMIALKRWPTRDCCHSINGYLWRFKGDVAYSGNEVITREEWQKEHFFGRWTA